MTSDERWYQQDGEESASTMVTLARRLQDKQTRSKNDFMLHASLYGGSEYLEDDSAQDTTNTQLSLNVVRSMIETATSYIAARSRPKATVLTRGDWRLRQKARKLDKSIYGAMYMGGFYRILPLAFRDGCVFGDGWVHVTRNSSQDGVVYDRALPREVIYDEGEAKNAEPRSLYRLRYIDRAVASETWPEAADKIAALPTLRESDTYGSSYDASGDQVKVWEAWHLPSSKTAKDGVYLVALDTGNAEGIELSRREWTRHRFPLVRYQWSPALMGYGRGTGLARELCGIQLEINDVLESISEANHGIKGFWAIERSSDVETSYLTDEFDKVLEYNVAPPQYYAPQAVSGDTYGYLDRLVQKAYETTGISLLSATSQKPAGLNSGAAIRAYDDRQSDRFKHKYAMLEDFCVDIARCTYEELRDIATDTGALVKIQAIDDDRLTDADFESNAMDDAPFEMVIKPSSQMPTDIAGQIDLISQFAQSGMLDPEALLDLISSPDIELLSKRQNVTRRITERAMQAIAEDQEYMAPEPELNLALAARVAVEIYLQSRLDGAPPEVRDLMMRWIAQVRAMILKLTPPPPMPAAQALPPMDPNV